MNPMHLHFLRHAFALAKRVEGRTLPNPAVGCVLVRQGRVIAAAHTGCNGRPHAETQALEMAGGQAAGATAYVTLEPCAHDGRTPSCAAALIHAAIGEVVIACRDPDPRTNGQGIAMLREAGIAVREIRCGMEEIYRGFFRRVREGLPEINLKIATSLDGHIASHRGESQWITGEAARHYGHMLRARHEAIITGISTVLADDPRLDCRIGGMEDASPIRVVLDRRLRLPVESALAQTARDIPVWLCTAAGALKAEEERAKALMQHGVRIIAPDGDFLPLPEIARLLATEGVMRALVEAGPTLTTHALESGLWNTLYWFRAPLLLGADGHPAFRLSNTALASAPRLHAQRVRTLGKDRLEVYRNGHNATQD